MKLYKIEMLTVAPKNNWTNIYGYAVFDTVDELYDYLYKKAYWEDKEINDETGENEDKIYTLYDEDYNKIGTESFKERMLRICGEANDEDLPWEDLYYGMSNYSWVDMGDITDDEIKTLTKLKILIEAE